MSVSTSQAREKDCRLTIIMGAFHVQLHIAATTSGRPFCSAVIAMEVSVALRLGLFPGFFFLESSHHLPTLLLHLLQGFQARLFASLPMRLLSGHPLRSDVPALLLSSNVLSLARVVDGLDGALVLVALLFAISHARFVRSSQFALLPR
jgi:hypothetical protein